jgi:transcription elongation factor Elf1
MTERDDIERIAQRLLIYAPREISREKLGEVKEEYRRKVDKLSALEQRRLGCPECGRREGVIITGNGKQRGTKKFLCKCGRRFSTYTSWDALEVYREFIVEILTLFATCNGTQRGIGNYLSATRHLVELAFALCERRIGKECERIKCEDDGDLVVVHLDFSSTRISRKLAVIGARIGNEVVYKVAWAVNCLTAWDFVRELKQKLVVSPRKKLVFVSDGEVAWIHPIRSFFPGSVHIRQFHSRPCKGIVYTHFEYEERIYTFRCLWDVVLGEGMAGEKVLRQRKKRAGTGGHKEKSELFDGAILWEGTVERARGSRSLTKHGGATHTGAIAGACKTELEAPNPPELGDENGEGETAGEPRAERIASTGDAPKRVFKGSLEDALLIEPVSYLHEILVKAFGGLHITNNKAEGLFSLKAALKYHRTLKAGRRFLNVFFYCKTKFRSADVHEIRKHFRELIPVEAVRRAVISRSPRRASEEVDTEQIVGESLGRRFPLVISYKDSGGRRTSRMLEPLELTKDPYTEHLYLRAYCWLRREERTFRVDRILKAMPARDGFRTVSLQ